MQPSSNLAFNFENTQGLTENVVHEQKKSTGEFLNKEKKLHKKRWGSKHYGKRVTGDTV